MPRLRQNPWADLAPAAPAPPPDDHALLRRFLAWRARSIPPARVARERNWLLEWLALCGQRGRGLRDADGEEVAALAERFRVDRVPFNHGIRLGQAVVGLYDYLMAHDLATCNPWRDPLGAARTLEEVGDVRQSWKGWSLANAPISDHDKRLLRRYLDWRAVHSPELAAREECWIGRWLSFLADRGVPLEAATEEDAIALASQFAEWQWSPSTVQHFCAAMRSWSGWCMDRGAIAKDPWRRVKAPRQVQKVPRVMSPAEVASVVNALDRPHWRDLRDRALICVLASTGCRISEVLGLNMGDLEMGGPDMPVGRATVMGKWRKERHALLDEAAVDALTVYLRAARPALTSRKDGPVFVGTHGKRLVPLVAREALQRAAQRAGLDRHIWPHLIRHSVATDLLDGGMDIRVVQEVLGHASIRSTERYVHVAQQKVREEYQKAHGLTAGARRRAPANRPAQEGSR